MSANRQTLIGKTLLIGITRLDEAGEPIEQRQFYGVISIATEDCLEIILPSGETYSLPPDYSNIFAAPPDEYRLRSTGEVVVNPDYTTTWSIMPAATLEEL